jgi:hypothetical protein
MLGLPVYSFRTMAFGCVAWCSITAATLRHASANFSPPPVSVCEEAIRPPIDAPRPQDRVGGIRLGSGNQIEIVFLRDPEHRLTSTGVYEDAILEAFQELADLVGQPFEALPRRIFVRIHDVPSWGSRAFSKEAMALVRVRADLKETQNVAIHELGHVILTANIPGWTERSARQPAGPMLDEFFADSMAWIRRPETDVMSRTVGDKTTFREFLPGFTIRSRMDDLQRHLLHLTETRPESVRAYVFNGHIMGPGLRSKLAEHPEVRDPKLQFTTRLIRAIDQALRMEASSPPIPGLVGPHRETSRVICKLLGWDPR